MPQQQQHCYVVPGFAGCELHFKPPRTGKVYVNAAQLYVGGLLGMALDQNGQAALNGSRWEMVGGPPLEDYFRPIRNVLGGQLAQVGYETHDFSWDWRKDITIAGDDLANQIRQTSSPSRPASVVAHSTGGLVARWAWYRLGQTGQQNLLRRIVTLGTPHRGTYASVRVFSLGDPTIAQIRGLVDAVVYIGGFPGFVLGASVPTALEIENVFATFPSLYQLMPLVDAQSADTDPNRPHLFDATHWPIDRKLSPIHLANAAGGWADWMKSPDSMPPARVLTCVAGTGFRTPVRLMRPDQLGLMNALDLTVHGDATVPLESALVAGRPQIIVPVEHFALTIDSFVGNRVTQWVLEERDDETPLPPVLSIPGVPQTFVNAPPTPNQPATIYVDPALNILPDPGSIPDPGGAFPGFHPLAGVGGGSMPFHVSFDYIQSMGRTGGWTENYWNNVTALADCETEAKELARQLQTLHGRSSVLKTIRIANASPEGVTVKVPRRVKPIVFQIDVNDRVTGTQYSDYPTNALAIKVGDGADANVVQWIRGTRDAFVDKGGVLLTDLPAFAAAFELYAGALTDKNAHWCVRVLNPVFGEKVVAAIGADGKVTMIEAHAYDPGVKVRIRNCQTNKYPNKVWRISLTSDTKVFQLLQWNPPTPFVPVTGENITARLQSYKYVPIKVVVPKFATKKNVGKPRDLLTGKQKKHR